MFQLIFTLFNLVFANLFLYVNDSDKNSYSNDSYDEAYEASHKPKNSSSSKKKKPKRNRSAFIIFSSEMRAKLRNDQFEKLNSNEMMVRLAELWKNLGENDKKKYHDQAEQEKVRYMTELNTFYQKNPFEVIQNKTKKNHIKKPCSAYAIYLKETKKEIKFDHPDLKMADILKIVAERWKQLSDDRRIIFQRKAQAEKELTKAKISQQQSQEEESNKRDSKKSSASSKRPQKSLQDSVKIECNQTSSEVKIESYDHYVEPMPTKQHIVNYNMPSANYNYVSHNNYSNNYSNNYYPDLNRHISTLDNDFSFMDMNMFNQQGLRVPNFENQMRAPEYNNYNKISNLLSYLPQSMFPKQQAQPEYREYQQPIYPKQEEGFFVKDEYNYENEEADPTTAPNMTPSSWNSTSKSQVINDCCYGTSEDDFRLDDHELEKTFEHFESAAHQFKHRMTDDYVSFM